jgi:hypothetical protein
MESISPVHQFVIGFDYHGTPSLPTGNTPASNTDWLITSVTSSGTASFNSAAVWPPAYLLTTGTTANDQVVFQDKRLAKKNFLSLRKVLIAGAFQITSTVANSKLAFGLFSGTSVSSLGNDQFAFSATGATLSFVNRNNGGTALSTTVSTGLTINTMYAAAALLDPSKSQVSIWFGPIDSLDYTLSTNTPQELPLADSNLAVTTSNIPDGTNSIQCGFGAQTTAGAAATVQFGPVIAYLF